MSPSVADVSLGLWRELQSGRTDDVEDAVLYV